MLSSLVSIENLRCLAWILEITRVRAVALSAFFFIRRHGRCVQQSLPPVKYTNLFGHAECDIAAVHAGMYLQMLSLGIEQRWHSIRSQLKTMFATGVVTSAVRNVPLLKIHLPPTQL